MREKRQRKGGRYREGGLGDDSAVSMLISKREGVE